MNQNSKKGIWVAFGIVVVFIIAGGAFWMSAKQSLLEEDEPQSLIIDFQKEENKTDKIDQNTVSQNTDVVSFQDGEGAGGSGLDEFPPASKYCKDQTVPGEQIFGESLIISADKKTVFLNDKVAISISDLPTTIQVSPDSFFGVINKEFTSAVLSPTKSVIAFSISGGTHGWGGLKNVFSGLVYPVAFQFEGSVSEPKWDNNGKYVVFSKTTPKPETVLTLVTAQGLKTYTSEYEKVLSFQDINPLPSEISSRLKNHYWSKEKDNKFYFLVVSTGSTKNSEHAELWFINADIGKWNFYCTSY